VPDYAHVAFRDSKISSPSATTCPEAVAKLHSAFKKRVDVRRKVISSRLPVDTSLTRKT
jgi:hypothetical protein